mgnify:CR=1 FL=1
MDRELVAKGDETHEVSFKASLGKICDFSGHATEAWDSFGTKLSA